MGKGDTPRPVNKKVYDAEYERIFGKRKFKTWDDAPRFGEDDQPHGGQAAGVPEESGSQPDSETPGALEGEENS